MNTTDPIIASGGWVPRQRHGRPRARKARRIAFALLVAVACAVLWLCRTDGTPTQQEHPILLRGGDILAWFIIMVDLALWIRAATLAVREPPEDFEETIKNPDVDPRRLY